MLDLEKMTAVVEQQAEFIKLGGIEEIGTSDMNHWVFSMMDELGFDRDDVGLFGILREALSNRI